MRDILTDIENHPFDLLIIGAGINGAGIARDAAMRGLRVLLLDKGDIASGTTSWSTRLIHGGLRYLEHGELGLVRESLRERERLLHIAPHLVKPLRLSIPIYKHSKRGPLTIRAGMLVYDLLSFDKSLKRHRMLSRDETRARLPGIDSEGLRGAALYYDSQIEYAERLVLENILSAQEHGAQIVTYARVDKFIVEDKCVLGVMFTDLLGAGTHVAKAPLTVNVSGPWVDDVLELADRTIDRQIGGTQGSHIIVEKFPGAPDDALYVEAREDGRAFFIIPWNELYLIGTTDRIYDGDLNHVEATDAEIGYLIRETNRVVPSARLNRASILYTYSGVRPLPYRAVGDPAAITRRHFIRDHAPEPEGLVSIVGGKLTTYRNLSEQTVNLIMKKLKRRPVHCATSLERLPGAMTEDFDAFSENFRAQSGLCEKTANRLLRVYGTRATDVLEIAAEDPELLKPFSPLTGAIGAEVLFSFQREMAQTLTDCLMRRTMVGLNAAVGLDAATGAVQIAQRSLGWDEARVKRELAAYRDYIRRLHPRFGVTGGSISA